MYRLVIILVKVQVSQPQDLNPPHNHPPNTHASYTPPRDNPAAHTPEADTPAAGTPAEAAAEEHNVPTGSLWEEGLGGGKTAGAAHSPPAYNLETRSLTEEAVHGTPACIRLVVEVAADTAATDGAPSTVARGGTVAEVRRGFAGEEGDHGVEEKSCGGRCFGAKVVVDGFLLLHLLHPCIESQSSGRLR